jgi:hypothetical protein
MTQPQTGKKSLPHERELRPEEQAVLIDLPGEEYKIQPNMCYAKNKVYIVLRRHRDVIFDLSLAPGTSYTLEADQDVFYDPKLKKQRTHATFNDGERFHIWLPRNFKGHLTLKGNNRVLIHYTMRQLDPHPYSGDPDEKPAPIMIAFGAGLSPLFGSTANTSTLNALKTKSGLQPSPFGENSRREKDYSPIPIRPDIRETLASANGRKSHDETNAHETMHIVEIKQTHGADVPRQAAEFFEKGGEQTAIDANGMLTRNWLWAQIAGTAAYYSDNQHWVNEL